MKTLRTIALLTVLASFLFAAGAQAAPTIGVYFGPNQMPWKTAAPNQPFDIWIIVVLCIMLNKSNFRPQRTKSSSGNKSIPFLREGDDFNWNIIKNIFNLKFIEIQPVHQVVDKLVFIVDRPPDQLDCIRHGSLTPSAPFRPPTARCRS